MKPTLLILAAGIGSRYGSLKQIDKIGPSAETIVDYSIYDAIRAGFGKVVFVIRKNIENEFKKVFFNDLSKKIKVDYVFQEIGNITDKMIYSKERTKPWGTAHAVLVAAPKINEPFVVINSDDFYGAEAYKTIAEYFSSPDKDYVSKYCMLGYNIKNTLSDFGPVSRGICETDKQGNLKGIIERTHIEKKENNIEYKDENNNWKKLSGNEIVSMNMWGFAPSVFKHIKYYFDKFIKENANNPKAEFYIPFFINKLIKRNIIKVKVLNSDAKWFGVTYKEDKPFAIKKVQELVDKGIYPDNLWR